MVQFLVLFLYTQSCLSEEESASCFTLYYCCPSPVSLSRGCRVIVCGVLIIIICFYLQHLVMNNRSSNYFNPFKPNEISHSNQLDQPISVLRVVGSIFHLNSNFVRTFSKQTVEILIRRRVLRRLIWVCTVCLCPTKRTLVLYGLKKSKVPFVHCMHQFKSAVMIIEIRSK